MIHFMLVFSIKAELKFNSAVGKKKRRPLMLDFYNLRQN